MATKHDLGSVVVVGLGVSGWATVDFLSSYKGISVKNIVVYTGGKSAPLTDDQLEHLKSCGAKVVEGVDEIQGHFDLAIMSPGIAPTNLLFTSAKACSEEIICESELAYRVSPQKWIAITGTNGKTTTTSLIAHILNACGYRARSCGNIGLPCVQAVLNRQPDEYLVAELSSFQLHSMPTFSPDIALLLNITSDHIEWHGDLDSYAMDKASVFSNQAQDNFAILGCDNKKAFEIAQKLAEQKRQIICVGGPSGITQKESLSCSGGSAYVEDGVLIVEINGQIHRLCNCDELPIKGDHNISNVLASAAACLCLGVADRDLSLALKNYSAQPHRMQVVGTKFDITFVDDSKATNTDAAIKALTAYPDKNVIMLLGGHDKGTNLDSLVEAAIAACKTIICYGEAGDRFYDAFSSALGNLSDNDLSQRSQTSTSSGISCTDIVKTTGACVRSSMQPKLLKAKRLKDAFEISLTQARPSDVILLSPACSSFDEFTSYIERGEYFVQLVEELDEATLASTHRKES